MEATFSSATKRNEEEGTKQSTQLKAKPNLTINGRHQQEEDEATFNQRSQRFHIAAAAPHHLLSPSLCYWDVSIQMQLHCYEPHVPHRPFFVRWFVYPKEIDLYDSNNEEIPVDFSDFMQHDGEKIVEAIADEGKLMSVDDGADDTTIKDGSGKKLIECQASIVLPFSAEVALDAFLDLTSQL